MPTTTGGKTNGEIINVRTMPESFFEVCRSTAT